MSMCMDNDGHLATFETLKELSEMRRLLQKSLGTNGRIYFTVLVPSCKNWSYNNTAMMALRCNQSQ